LDTLGYLVQVVGIPREEGEGEVTVGRGSEDSSYAGTLFLFSRPCWIGERELRTDVGPAPINMASPLGGIVFEDGEMCVTVIKSRELLGKLSNFRKLRYD
jgi:hypothetical protein